MRGRACRYLGAAALALALLTSCTRTVTVRVPVIAACRSQDYPRPREGLVYGTMEWASWFAREVVPWMLRVEAECPRRGT